MSLGRGRLDHECELRETARLFHAFGEREFALSLLCTSEAVARSGLECVPPPKVVYVPGDCSAADEKLRRCESVTGVK